MKIVLADADYGPQAEAARLVACRKAGACVPGSQWRYANAAEPFSC